jgi:P27 family predicted phage terminase small subunit
MAKKGPRPTPTAELAARGSHRAKEPRRRNEITIPPLLDVPVAPEWLTDAAQGHFERLAPMLHATGLLSLADVDVLSMLAERLAQYTDLRDQCAEEKPTIYNEQGVGRKNPTYSLRDEAGRDLLKLYQELGMSPTARVGLTAEKKTATPATLMMETEGGYAT